MDNQLVKAVAIYISKLLAIDQSLTNAGRSGMVVSARDVSTKSR